VDNFLEARQKVITLDGNGDVTRFIYNNDDRSPVYLQPDQADRHYAAIRALLSEIQNPANQHSVQPAPGMDMQTHIFCLESTDWPESTRFHTRAYAGDQQLAGHARPDGVHRLSSPERCATLYVSFTMANMDSPTQLCAGSYLSMDHFGSRTRTLLQAQGLH
jgi:hypothetical protein